MLSPGINAAIEAAAQATAVRPVHPGRVVHIDGDYLAYFCAGNDDMPVGTARMVTLDRINKLIEVSGAERALVHMTDDCSNKGLRYQVATIKPYQGNRSGKGKPKNWAAVRDFLLTAGGFDRAVWRDREADDGIALAAQRAVDAGDHTLCAIATRDKDMRMLPGLHISWQDFEQTEVAPDQFEVTDSSHLVYGMKWFWLQTLQGDTTDNIPGLEMYRPVMLGSPKKVGDVTAAKILANCTTSEQASYAVVEAYGSYYGEDDCAARFIEQAALLWLRRDPHAEVFNFLLHLPSWLRESDEIQLAVKAMTERLTDDAAH